MVGLSSLRYLVSPLCGLLYIQNLNPPCLCPICNPISFLYFLIFYLAMPYVIHEDGDTIVICNMGSHPVALGCITVLCPTPLFHGPPTLEKNPSLYHLHFIPSFYPLSKKRYVSATLPSHTSSPTTSLSWNFFCRRGYRRCNCFHFHLVSAHCFHVFNVTSPPLPPPLTYLFTSFRNFLKFWTCTNPKYSSSRPAYWVESLICIKITMFSITDHVP